MYSVGKNEKKRGARLSAALKVDLIIKNKLATHKKVRNHRHFCCASIIAPTSPRRPMATVNSGRLCEQMEPGWGRTLL